MAHLTLGNIQGPSNLVTLQPGTNLVASTTGGIYAPGMVLQTVWNNTSSRRTYTSPTSTVGQAINELDINIKPTRSNSIIWLQYMVFYEMHHDNVFTILRDGSLVGYNTTAGNNNWSGVAVSPYDTDESSTPRTQYISWYDTPGGTSNYRYSLAVRCSTGTSYTFALNRTISSWGQDSYETGVSAVVAMEIAQ